MAWWRGESESAEYFSPGPTRHGEYHHGSSLVACIVMLLVWGSDGCFQGVGPEGGGGGGEGAIGTLSSPHHVTWRPGRPPCSSGQGGLGAVSKGWGGVSEACGTRVLYAHRVVHTMCRPPCSSGQGDREPTWCDFLWGYTCRLLVVMRSM